jgi:hypothetical protein
LILVYAAKECKTGNTLSYLFCMYTLNMYIHFKNHRSEKLHSIIFYCFRELLGINKLIYLYMLVYNMWICFILIGWLVFTIFEQFGNGWLYLAMELMTHNMMFCYSILNLNNSSFILLLWYLTYHIMGMDFSNIQKIFSFNCNLNASTKIKSKVFATCQGFFLLKWSRLTFRNCFAQLFFF